MKRAWEIATWIILGVLMTFFMIGVCLIYGGAPIPGV